MDNIDENLKKTFDCLIDKGEISPKLMKEYGVNFYFLNKLVDEGYLVKLKRGQYGLSNLANFYKYVLTLAEKGNLELAFKIIFKYFPTDKKMDYMMHFFEVCLDSDNEEFIVAHLDDIYTIGGKTNHKDFNLLVYLLSFMTELHGYESYVKNLKMEDILVDVDDKEYLDYEMSNQIRRLIYIQRFNSALKVFEDDKMNVRNRFWKTFIKKICRKYSSFYKAINEMIEDKKYEMVVDTLEKEGAKHKMKDYNLIILTLTRDLIQIINTGVIPEEKDIPKKAPHNFFNAVKAKKYDLALKLHREHTKKHKKSASPDIITSLLTDIIVNRNEIIKKREPSFLQKELAKNSEGTSPLKAKNDRILREGFFDLVNGDLSSAVEKIETYLNNIGQSQYAHLIGGLIFNCVLEKDNAFVKPMQTICAISKGEFKPPIDEYIEDFRWYLSKSKKNQAKIFLDIIREYAPLANVDIDMTGLLWEYDEGLETVKAELDAHEEDFEKLVLENSNILRSSILDLKAGLTSLAVDKIEVYLDNINRSEYFILIARLISVCEIENDEEFTEPINVLNEISTGSFAIPVYTYIERYKEYVSKYHFQQAMQYLHIIREYAWQMEIDIDVDELEKDLEQKGKNCGFTIRIAKKKRN